MLTNNIDIDNRLINGQIGTAFQVKYNIQRKVETVYVKFDDELTRVKQMHLDPFAFSNNCASK